MFRSTRRKIVTLILVGAVALGGAGYAVASLTMRDVSASTPPAQVQQAQPRPASAEPAQAQSVSTQGQTQGATDPQLRAAILDMLRVRMGLTGAAAENFADRMIARMPNAGNGFNLQQMINWCTQYINQSPRGSSGSGNSATGSGPANGGGSSSGSGSPANSGIGFCNPRGAVQSGAQSGPSSNYTPRGMMGGWTVQ